MGAGVLLLVWPLWVTVDSARAQQWSPKESPGQETVVPAGSRKSTPVAAAKRGQPLAKFKIDRLKMEWVLLEGTDNKTLDRSIGHVENTGLPGDTGNISIAGHRNTHFRKLEWVRRGDVIKLETKAATYEYAVEWVRLFQTTDLQVLDAEHGPAVTLITCFPFEYVGSAPLRFIVRALPTEDTLTKLKASEGKSE
jgi:sortase A